MKDRVPGAPGQYKAVILAGDLQKMQMGEPFVITMTRDDQPIVEGTPYSKAAVLPDDVAQKICPNVEDPTPADAFRALCADFVLAPGSAADSIVQKVTEPSGDGVNDPQPVSSERGAVALGRYTKAKAKEAMAVNYNNAANARNSFAANSDNEVNGVDGTAFGHSNVVEENAAAGFVAGVGNRAAKYAQMVSGMYNKRDEKALLVVGDGTSEADRRNAIAVYGRSSLEASDLKLRIPADFGTVQYIEFLSRGDDTTDGSTAPNLIIDNFNVFDDNNIYYNNDFSANTDGIAFDSWHSNYSKRDADGEYLYLRAHSWNNAVAYWNKGEDGKAAQQLPDKFVVSFGYTAIDKWAVWEMRLVDENGNYIRVLSNNGRDGATNFLYTDGTTDKANYTFPKLSTANDIDYHFVTLAFDMTANTYSYMCGNNTVSVAFGDTVIEEMVDGSILVNGRRLLISNDVDNTLTFAGKAADAKATGDALAKKAEYVLLWANASKTSAFVGQSLAVSTVGYDYLMIVCGYGTSTRNGTTATHYRLRPIGDGDTEVGLAVNYISNTIGLSIPFRKLVVSLNRKSLTFDTGHRSDGTEDNAYCIPYYIYGIKGVSNQ